MKRIEKFHESLQFDRTDVQRIVQAQQDGIITTFTLTTMSVMNGRRDPNVCLWCGKVQSIDHNCEMVPDYNCWFSFGKEDDGVAFVKVSTYGLQHVEDDVVSSAHNMFDEVSKPSMDDRKADEVEMDARKVFDEFSEPTLSLVIHQPDAQNMLDELPVPTFIIEMAKAATIAELGPVQDDTLDFGAHNIFDEMSEPISNPNQHDMNKQGCEPDDIQSTVEAIDIHKVPKTPKTIRYDFDLLQANVDVVFENKMKCSTLDIKVINAHKMLDEMPLTAFISEMPRRTKGEEDNFFVRSTQKLSNVVVLWSDFMYSQLSTSSLPNFIFDPGGKRIKMVPEIFDGPFNCVCHVRMECQIKIFDPGLILMDISPGQDTMGPICRTMADGVYVLDAIVGFDLHNSEATGNASKYIPTRGYLLIKLAHMSCNITSYNLGCTYGDPANIDTFRRNRLHKFVDPGIGVIKLVLSYNLTLEDKGVFRGKEDKLYEKYSRARFIGVVSTTITFDPGGLEYETYRNGYDVRDVTDVSPPRWSMSSYDGSVSRSVHEFAAKRPFVPFSPMHSHFMFQNEPAKSAGLESLYIEECKLRRKTETELAEVRQELEWLKNHVAELPNKNEELQNSELDTGKAELEHLMNNVLGELGMAIKQKSLLESQIRNSTFLLDMLGEFIVQPTNLFLQWRPPQLKYSVQIYTHTIFVFDPGGHDSEPTITKRSQVYPYDAKRRKFRRREDYQSYVFDPGGSFVLQDHKSVRLWGMEGVMSFILEDKDNFKGSVLIHTKNIMEGRLVIYLFFSYSPS